MVKALQARQGR